MQSGFIPSDLDPLSVGLEGVGGGGNARLGGGWAVIVAVGGGDGCIIVSFSVLMGVGWVGNHP